MFDSSIKTKRNLCYDCGALPVGGLSLGSPYANLIFDLPRKQVQMQPTFLPEN